jgi:hypothetical protein
MERVINVLVFPCGAENAIEIHTALKDVVNINLFGGSGKEDHGSFIFKNYIGQIPYINEHNFIDYFNSVLAKNEIDIIFPTHDDISLYLSTNKERIIAKIEVPGLKQAEICRSKKAIYKLFENESFCPKVYDPYDFVEKFPLFVKPDKGQGGKGTFIIESANDLVFKNKFKLLDEFVVTEFLPGEEITVDCFTDRYGKLRFVGPRVRNRVFGGISVNSFTIPLSDEIKDISNKISQKLKMRGLWFFQLKKDEKDKYKLLEISVRTAGTMNLYRGLGVNFPLLTIYDLMEYDVEIIANDYYLEVDRALFNRYKSNLDYDTIYVDFDDTITRKGKVNPFVLFFLYNAKNNNKIIKLVTRHESNLYDTLSKLSIHPTLFDEIIHIKQDEDKHRIISEKSKVIFIDNSFKERVKVKKNLNIPVFDVDAINTLIDWRE